jgi:hypothetical protein
VAEFIRFPITLAEIDILAWSAAEGDDWSPHLDH